MNTRTNSFSPIIFVILISVVGMQFSVQASSASQGKSGQYLDKSSMLGKYAEKDEYPGSQEISLQVTEGWSVYPEVLTSTQFMNEVVTKTLVISNTSDVTLTYSLLPEEIPGDVLWMRLDEPFGAKAFQDDSPYSNHGSCKGQYCPIAGVGGKINKSLSFDGGDYLTVENNNNSLSLEEMTVSAWGRTDVTDNSHIIVYKNKLGTPVDNNINYSLSIKNDNLGVFKMRDSSNDLQQVVVGTSNLADGFWHNIVRTYDGTALRIYVDGIEENINNTGSFPPYQNPGPLQIGSNYLSSTNPGFFIGEIDQVSIFNRVFSADEIQDLYEAGRWGGLSLAPWLIIDPISGTLPADDTAEIMLMFDSGDLQPDTYSSRIVILSDNPLTPSVSLPFTMTVLPTAEMGQLVGTVYDSWTSKPMAASVELVGVHTAIAGPNFELWAPAGSYSLTASASGYRPVTKTVHITAGGVVTQNFILSRLRGELYLPVILHNYCSPYFFDDFSNPASGWYVGEDEYVRSMYSKGGEYRILTKQDGYVYVYSAPTCSKEDYEIEVDARWVGSSANSYGIVFGITQGFESYYLFEVNSDFRKYWLLRRDPSGWTFIRNVKGSNAIYHGLASNRLYVKRVGNNITLKVNGVKLGTWTDGNITGMTWVGISSTPYSGIPVSDARFDNFSVAVIRGSMYAGSRRMGGSLESGFRLEPYDGRFMVPFVE